MEVGACRILIARHRRQFVSRCSELVGMAVLVDMAMAGLGIAVGMHDTRRHAGQQQTQHQQAQQRTQAGWATRDAVSELGDEGNHRPSMKEAKHGHKPQRRSHAVLGAIPSGRQPRREGVSAPGLRCLRTQHQEDANTCGKH